MVFREKIFKNLIVRMPNWIGDFVMATPVLTDLRKAFPQAKITAFCKNPLGELLQQDPDVDEVFHFTSPKESFFQRKERKDIIETLKVGHYDLGILLTNSFSSAWLFWLGNVQNRMGYRKHFRRILLDRSLPYPPKGRQHQVVTYKKLLTLLDLKVSSTVPRLFLEEEEIRRSKKLLYQRGFRDGNLLVGIHPGSSYGEAKCWMPERFQEVTEKLIQNKNIFVVFLGNSRAESLIKKICQKFPERVINLAGLTSLRDLCCIIQNCQVVLSNDSGPMHLAGALGVPVVALFGSSSEEESGPEYAKKSFVFNKKVMCSPCFKRVCTTDFICMKNILVDEVVDKIKEFLGT